MTDTNISTTRADKKGLGPGALVHIGQQKNIPVTVNAIIYDQNGNQEFNINDLSACNAMADSQSISWVNVDGIHNADVIAEIGRQFKIHSLVLEDVMNSTSRPKVEIFDDYIFITLKMLERKDNIKGLRVEQLSAIIGKNYLITFQENPEDSFDSIRERIRTAKGKVRTKDAYYLLYLILDTIIDNYIAVSEKFSNQISQFESVVLRKPDEQTQQKILALRKELLDFKRSVDPLKDAVNTIMREMDDDIAKYYRDLYDHIIYESENLGMYREMLANLLDLYHSNLGMKMNQIIKVLTIITTIFVPLTFLAGIYGMNFENMPELRTKYGYYVVLGVMLGLVISMLIYFRKKKWI